MCKSVKKNTTIELLRFQICIKHVLCSFIEAIKEIIKRNKQNNFSKTLLLIIFSRIE